MQILCQKTKEKTKAFSIKFMQFIINNFAFTVTYANFFAFVLLKKIYLLYLPTMGGVK